MIEASKLVTVEVENRSQIPLLCGIHMACRLCIHYIDDFVPYVPLELHVCSYWGCGHFTSPVAIYFSVVMR